MWDWKKNELHDHICRNVYMCMNVYFYIYTGSHRQIQQSTNTKYLN